MDYCDVFISCLDSHSDGTHSLHSIHCWVSDAMLNFFWQICSDKETYTSWMAWGWVHFQQTHFLVNYSFKLLYLWFSDVWVTAELLKRTSVCVIFYHCVSDTLSESRRNWRQCILVETVLKSTSHHNEFNKVTKQSKCCQWIQMGKRKTVQYRKCLILRESFLLCASDLIYLYYC